MRHFLLQGLHSSILNLGLLVPLGGRLPVDNIPDGTEVLSLAVLVLEIVGVLPRINTHDGHVLADNRVLVL
jgi:hypothetical protein